MLRPGTGLEPGAGGYRHRGMLRMTSSSPVPARSTPAPASALEQLSSAHMLATVRELAGDRYAGRRVGTPGGRAAGVWLAGSLRELNAEPETMRFPVSACVSCMRRRSCNGGSAGS